MKIETELNGNFVISPNGKEGDTLTILTAGRATRLTEKDGKIRQENAGRVVGFMFADKTKPAAPRRAE